MLPQQIEIALRNGVRIEHAVGLIGRIGPTVAADAAIDDDVSDVNALRRKLARHALRQSAQRELAHGERRRLGITLHARRRAGQKDGATPSRQPTRLGGRRTRRRR